MLRLLLQPHWTAKRHYGWPITIQQHIDTNLALIGWFSLAFTHFKASLAAKEHVSSSLGRVVKWPCSWENPLEKEKHLMLQPCLLGSFLAVFGGHVSHTKRGDNMACHIWLETSGSLLTPPSGITHFGFHLPSENIKMDRLVWTAFNLHGLEEWSGSSSSTWDNLILSLGPRI